MAGQADGKIAVILVQGTNYIRAEIMCMLSFHSTPIMFLQESPCSNYVCSLAEDEVLFVWKHADAEKNKESQKQNMAFALEST